MATITPSAPKQEDVLPVIPVDGPLSIDPNQGADDGAGSTGTGSSTIPATPPPGWGFLDGQKDAPYSTPGSVDPNADAEAQRKFERDKVIAQQNALVDIEALDVEYQRLIGNLRGQYQTSQTPQEKERLRFILADIEAQHEAGVEAISSLYAETTQKLNEQSRTYRGGIEGRAQEVEGSFTRLAEDAVSRNLARREGLAEQYRGYGIAGGYDPRDANTDFLSSLAPIQGNYSRMIGESTAGGIDFIANMAEMQGNAQQGDLKRLAATTRTAAIQTHEAQVAARTQAERAAQRGDTMQLNMAALASRQSAMDLNARLMNQAIQAEQFVPGQDVGKRYAEMVSAAASLGKQKLDPEQFAEFFQSQFGGTPPPEFREMYIASYHSAALEEMTQIQANIKKLELPPNDPTVVAYRRRIQDLVEVLAQFGLSSIPQN